MSPEDEHNVQLTTEPDPDPIGAKGTINEQNVFFTNFRKNMRAAKMAPPVEEAAAFKRDALFARAIGLILQNPKPKR